MKDEYLKESPYSINKASVLETAEKESKKN
jgi:hypothetical protein